jgi:hypothetical protein
MSAFLRGARSAIGTVWSNSTRRCWRPYCMPHFAFIKAVEHRTSARPRSRVQQVSAPRGESLTNAFVRRKNAITISSCEQHETRMISIILSVSNACDVASFSSSRVRCCSPEEFHIPQFNHKILRSQSSICGIKFHQIHSDLCNIYWMQRSMTGTSLSA